MRNTDLASNKPRDRRLKDEEHRPNHKQTKRQKIERVSFLGDYYF
jgi:hypothetical protein